MIAVDTSALFAIALKEAKADLCLDALRSHERLLISAGTVAEALIVAGRRAFAEPMARILNSYGFEIIPVTAETAERIGAAYTLWGRGMHPAALNFGDCFSYDVAATYDCPLLYVGNDFARTNIRSAIAST